MPNKDTGVTNYEPVVEYLAGVEGRLAEFAQAREELDAPGGEDNELTWNAYIFARERSQADVVTLERIVFVLLQTAKDYKLKDALACVDRIARGAMEKRNA